VLDRRIKTDAHRIIVAGKLLAIYDRTLGAKSRRRRNEYPLSWFPELLCHHLDAESADISRGNDFKDSRFLKAG